MDKVTKEYLDTLFPNYESCLADDLNKLIMDCRDVFGMRMKVYLGDEECVDIHSPKELAEYKFSIDDALVYIPLANDMLVDGKYKKMYLHWYFIAGIFTAYPMDDEDFKKLEESYIKVFEEGV